MGVGCECRRCRRWQRPQSCGSACLWNVVGVSCVRVLLVSIDNTYHVCHVGWPCAYGTHTVRTKRRAYSTHSARATRVPSARMRHSCSMTHVRELRSVSRGPRGKIKTLVIVMHAILGAPRWSPRAVCVYVGTVNRRHLLQYMHRLPHRISCVNTSAIRRHRPHHLLLHQSQSLH